MGLLRKARKALKKVGKLAVKTAPMWSSFVPGGSVVSKVIGQVRGMRTPKGEPAFTPEQELGLAARPQAQNVFVRRFGIGPARNPKKARQLVQLRRMRGFYGRQAMKSPKRRIVAL